MAESNEEYQHGKPTEGMCCLCTMEDITEEDQNYVEYQSYPSMQWQAAQFELCVIQQLLETQFEQYITRVKAPTCQAELRRLLQAGPPIYISDKVALSLADEEHDTHVCKLWYAIDQKEHSAKLKGAVEGVERDTLWAELNEFVIEDEKVVGDDDEEDKNAKQKGWS